MKSVSEIPQQLFLPLRQCNRQQLTLSFELGGVDGLGRVFEELIFTRDISECGGSFVSRHLLAVGSTLKLAAAAGFLSLIQIAWSLEADSGHKYGFWFVQPLEE